MKRQIVYAVPNEKPFVVDHSDAFDEQPHEALVTPHVLEEVQLDDDRIYEVTRVRHFPPTSNYTNFARAFRFLQSICKDAEEEEEDVNPNARYRSREKTYITIIVLKLA
jgi:hypothetical protein